MQYIDLAANRNDVSLSEAFGEWFITVLEKTHEPIIRAFDVEAYYAEGQRVRLGLDKVTRI